MMAFNWEFWSYECTSTDCCCWFQFRYPCHRHCNCIFIGLVGFWFVPWTMYIVWYEGAYSDDACCHRHTFSDGAWVRGGFTGWPQSPIWFADSHIFQRRCFYGRVFASACLQAGCVCFRFGVCDFAKFQGPCCTGHPLVNSEAGKCGREKQFRRNAWLNIENIYKYFGVLNKPIQRNFGVCKQSVWDECIRAFQNVWVGGKFYKILSISIEFSHRINWSFVIIYKLPGELISKKEM